MHLVSLAPPNRLSSFVVPFVILISQNILIWNMHGLNMRACRVVIHEFLIQERVFALCLVETKLDVLSPSMATDLMGARFDYVCLPFMGASGGIVVAWSHDEWTVTTRTCRSFLSPLASPLTLHP